MIGIYVSSQIEKGPETTLVEQVVDEPVALPQVEVSNKPAFVKDNDVEKEEKERRLKTIKRLREEIICFRKLFQDLINTPTWKRLQQKSLDVDIKQLRYCHEEYTEEVREYYNKSHGLRVGIIVDPRVMGLSINALQNMLAPSMANTMADNNVVAAKPALLPNERVLPANRPIQPGSNVRVIEKHHRLGGVKAALSIPPPQESREVNKTYDGEERQRMQNIKFHGKANIGPASKNYPNFVRPFYARPRQTQHAPITIKTSRR